MAFLKQKVAMFRSNLLRVCFGSILFVVLAFRSTSDGAGEAALARVTRLAGLSFSELSHSYRRYPSGFRLQHQELSRKIVVLGDANYKLPAEGKKTQKVSATDNALHEMQLAGLTALNVAIALREKLKPMIADPQVTITVVDTIMRPQPLSDKPSPQLRDTPPPALKQSIDSV